MAIPAHAFTSYRSYRNHEEYFENYLGFSFALSYKRERSLMMLINMSCRNKEENVFTIKRVMNNGSMLFQIFTGIKVPVTFIGFFLF